MFAELKESIRSQLEQDIGVPVILANQTSPKLQYPNIYFSVITPYIPQFMGNYSFDGDNLTLEEQPTCTLSFTAQSKSRGAGTNFVSGEDEALETAEKAYLWFRHQGYAFLAYDLDVTVVNITNVASRTALVVDEIVRRYGFDVQIRYTSTQSYQTGKIENISLEEI